MMKTLLATTAAVGLLAGVTIAGAQGTGGTSGATGAGGASHGQMDKQSGSEKSGRTSEGA